MGRDLAVAWRRCNPHLSILVVSRKGHTGDGCQNPAALGQ